MAISTDDGGGGTSGATGTVFKISAAVRDTLHQFSGPDGAFPSGG